MLENGDPIRRRKREVQNDRIQILERDMFQHIAPVNVPRHLMPSRAQATLDRLAQILIVLDQQNVHGAHANNSPVRLYSTKCGAGVQAGA